MTNTSKKVQALLFSALMVLSVFAGVVAFSGSAFGTAVGDAELADSGVTYWQGQDIWLENGTTTKWYHLGEMVPPEIVPLIPSEDKIIVPFILFLEMLSGL